MTLQKDIVEKIYDQQEQLSVDEELLEILIDFLDDIDSGKRSDTSVKTTLLEEVNSIIES